MNIVNIDNKKVDQYHSNIPLFNKKKYLKSRVKVGDRQTEHQFIREIHV